MVSAISSHYSRRHGYMCFTSVQNIGLVCLCCMFVKFSLFIYTTHAYLVQKQLGSGRRFLQWHLGLVQVCGTFSRFQQDVFIQHYWLTVSHCHRENLPVRNGKDALLTAFILFTSESGSSGWVSARWKVAGPFLSSGFIWHHHKPEDWAV